jgi:hypothetical protein
MDMLKGELTTKSHVLGDIDQLLNSLNTIDRQIQTEVDLCINEGEEKKMIHIKKLENDLISLQKTYHSQKPGQSSQTEKEHSYHLTLSY